VTPGSEIVRQFGGFSMSTGWKMHLRDGDLEMVPTEQMRLKEIVDVEIVRLSSFFLLMMPVTAFVGAIFFRAGYSNVGIGFLIACLGFSGLLVVSDLRNPQLSARRGPQTESITAINGLTLPPLLVSIMATGRWRHPGDQVIREVIPFLDGPVDFLGIEGIRHESRWGLVDIPWAAAGFHLARGSRSPSPVELPWLDVEKAVVIAVNRVHGDDIVIALDYRTDREDPRVVANRWLPAVRTGCVWCAVAGTFTEFARSLGLSGDP
jgi:hypothetical protein